MAYTKYSLTPANNTATPPDGAPEGMLPSAVNDTMRDMMAQIRDCGDGIRDGTYTMTAPKITGGTITGSTINNSAIGGTTAAAGAFTTLSATGVTTVQAGTVSLPAITTTGDTNTGIYFPAADTIGLTVGGVESARVVSGLLSIPANSTAPSAVRLYEDTDNGTNYVDFIAPSAITSNRTLTIPDETGTIITTASSGQSIPKAALPTGSVLQVVNTTLNGSQTSTSSSTFVTSGFSLAITPTSSTSKILIFASLAATNTNPTSSVTFTLYRGATQLNANGLGVYQNYSGSGYQQVQVAFNYLDSPSTTSSTTYTIYFKQSGGGTAYCGNSDGNQMITLMEVAA
jgi:hypothetical protein